MSSCSAACIKSPCVQIWTVNISCSLKQQALIVHLHIRAVKQHAATLSWRYITRRASRQQDQTLTVVQPPKVRRRRPKRGTGARTVFGTPELLEIILLGLDMKALLLSQHVSQTFKVTIRDSVVLQRKPFFKSPLEGTIAHCMEPQCAGRTSCRHVDREHIVNPLFCLDTGFIAPRSPGGYQDPERVSILEVSYYHADYRILGPYDYASWRKMFAAQPMHTEYPAECIIYRTNPCSIGSWRCWLQCGRRMESVMKALGNGPTEGKVSPATATIPMTAPPVMHANTSTGPRAQVTSTEWTRDLSKKSTSPS